MTSLCPSPRVPSPCPPVCVCVCPLQMKVPADLMLLPGHLFQLLEALREEQDRRATPGSPTTPGSPATPSAPEPP